MAVNNTWVQLGLEKAPTQRQIVNLIFKKAPVLGAVRMQAASAGFQNVYPELQEVVSGDIVPLNSAVPSTKADFKLGRTDLSKIAGNMVCGRDTANILGNGNLGNGKTVAFQQQIAQVLGMTLAKAEVTLYNTLRNFAIANGNYQSAGATTGSNQYSIIAVRYTDGVNMGLFNPNVLTNQAIFNVFDTLSGEAFEKDGILQFQRNFEAFWGLQLLDPKGVSAIVNIDPVESKIPTMKQLSKMLNDAQADGDTMIIMHPDIKTELQEYKLKQLELMPKDMDLNTLVDGIDGVPIIGSYNLPQATESIVS